MPAIKQKCIVCGKTQDLLSEYELAGVVIRNYACGHANSFTKLKELENYKSHSKNLTAYDFQQDGVKFILNSNARALVADEMGLGKTIQALLAVRSDPENLCPVLILCKSGLKMQWAKELITWCGPEYIPCVLDGAREFIIPGLKAYIISMDLLRRINGSGCKCGHNKRAHNKRVNSYDNMSGNAFSQRMQCSKCDCEDYDEPKKDEEDLIKRLGIKTVIIDEVQAIKNPESERTKQIRDLCSSSEHIIGLSGTPIKNHAGEYFTILNILRPDKFHTQTSFDYNWVSAYWDGYKMKRGALKNPQHFQEYTKDFIIRRTRNEVLPSLPNVSRVFRFCDLGAEVEAAYAAQFKEFQEYYNSTSNPDSFESQGNILAFLSKMRHLTGIAKIEPCVNFVEDFITETERDRKIVIFLHHKDVAVTIAEQLKRVRSEWPSEFGESVLQLSADLDSDKRNEVVERFNSPNNRILIASTLASGEGLNLQSCSDCIILERQWNPANEEQAEARFIRIGQRANKVTATYFVAVGTVDEFFSELVEKKRSIVSSALDGKETKWDQSSLVRELAAELASKGGKKWGW